MICVASIEGGSMAGFVGVMDSPMESDTDGDSSTEASGSIIGISMVGVDVGASMRIGIGASTSDA